MENLKKIYILHGWAYTTEKWDPFLDVLKKNGFSPIMLKIPGLTAPLEVPWTLEDYVNWFSGEIEKNTKINEPVFILGHSNGGRIAIAYAKTKIEKVKGLILVDSAGIYPKDKKSKIKKLIFGTLAKIGKFANKNEKIKNLFYKFVGENDYNDANPVMKETMKNLLSVDLTPILKSITCPVSVIWGRDDRSTPLRDGILMQKLFPNSNLNIIEGARHSPQFTNVEEVADIIKKFYVEKTNI